MVKILFGKIKESAISVMPVALIVLLLACTPLLQLSATEGVVFCVCAVLLVVGIGLFNMGADIAMTPMGIQVGAGLSKSRRMGVLLGSCFVLGVLITVAEPDLSVLAAQVAGVMDSTLLIVCVGVGVGLFLLLAVLKILTNTRLSSMLLFFYMVLFAVTSLVLLVGNGPLLSMAFDSGGVTTGPITVPFIMALGVGISSVLGNKHSQENSFGLVALCSVGPILAVLVLGIFAGNDLSYVVPDYTVSNDIVGAFLHTAAHTAKEVAIALGLIVAFFLICQIAFLRLPKRRLLRIAVGVVFTYIG
ncbi:MAG: DUF1538 domain-containing protein, partial [Clostridia bacterium]|nr:DUF1538 domain-containing protein [Clostridia bacterium]